MGRDMYVRIIEKDRKNNIWKQVKLYRKEKRKFRVVDVYPFRDHKLFDILDEDDEYCALPPQTADLPVALKNEIKSVEKTLGYYGLKEINLADLKLYLYKVPKIRDYDYEDSDPKAWIDNPVKNFIEAIERYIDFVDPYYSFYHTNSDIRIIYWFS